MQSARQPPFLLGLCPVAALLTAVLLAGCGATSPSGQEAPSITNAAVAGSALQRLKAPPGFRLGACDFPPESAYTRCYRRKGFVPLTSPRFAALITASGLTPDSDTVACPSFPRAHPDKPVTWDHCAAHASARSVDFVAFATSTKLHRAAIKPSDRTIADRLHGTVVELTVVATNAPRP